MNDAEANLDPPLVSTRAWCRTWSKAHVVFGRGKGWLCRKTAWRRLRYRLGRSIAAMAIALTRERWSSPAIFRRSVPADWRFTFMVPLLQGKLWRGEHGRGSLRAKPKGRGSLSQCLRSSSQTVSGRKRQSQRLPGAKGS